MHRMNSSTVYVQHLVLQKQAHGGLASPAEDKTLHITGEMASHGLQEQKKKSFLEGKTERSGLTAAVSAKAGAILT